MSYRTSLPLHPTEDDKPKKKKSLEEIRKQMSKKKRSESGKPKPSVFGKRKYSRLKRIKDEGNVDERVHKSQIFDHWNYWK